MSIYLSVYLYRIGGREGQTVFGQKVFDMWEREAREREEKRKTGNAEENKQLMEKDDATTTIPSSPSNTFGQAFMYPQLPRYRGINNFWPYGSTRSRSPARWRASTSRRFADTDPDIDTSINPDSSCGNRSRRPKPTGQLNTKNRAVVTVADFTPRCRRGRQLRGTCEGQKDTSNQAR